MFIQFVTLTFLMLSVSSGLAASDDNKPLAVVPKVELSRYAGKWYEIARLPNRFQKKCEGDVSATYELLDGGQIKVLNECRQKNGQITRAEGRARLADKSGPNSKLEVRFAPSWLGWFPLVWGDYWILDLAPDYSFSVVGTPDRKYLWILARLPQMEDEAYRKIMERVADRGFDTSRVIRTRQTVAR